MKDDILKLTQTCNAADEEVCEAANFLRAEGGNGAAVHRHGRELHRALHDAYMRVGADSASTGPVTSEAIRGVILDALGHYRRMLTALNDDLRAVSEHLP